jgi:hypothetical protein
MGHARIRKYLAMGDESVPLVEGNRIRLRGELDFAMSVLPCGELPDGTPDTSGSPDRGLGPIRSKLSYPRKRSS